MRRQNLLWLLVGLLLFVAPFLFRTLALGYLWRDYTPEELTLPDLAVTPIPTLAIAPPVAATPSAVGYLPARGDVVVDFVHGQPSSVSESHLQSLATALSGRGLRFHYWEDKSDWGLQPDERAEQLADKLHTASALILFDSWADWEEEELLIVDNFVRDGGRLLLFSDPDFWGTYIANISRIANRFGIVFDEGYLYNTETNDENLVHIPLQLVDAAESAEPLFAYGSHSVSGLIQPVAFGATDTRSSLQAGASYFPVIAQGDGRQARYLANVLAMGDFQLLTEPFVSRHANRQLLDFVAQFLAGGSRSWPMDSFPDYLDRSVELFLDNSLALDAGLTMRVAWLQEQLIASGRRVVFASQLPPFAITETTTITAQTGVLPTDTLYIGLLGKDAPADAFAQQMGDSLLWRDGLLTEIQLGSGIRLDADETILILRRRARPYGQVLAILATSPAAITAGVRRLQLADFAGCFQEPDRLFCPFSGPVSMGDSTAPPLSILIINDNDQAQADELSADFSLYLTTLRALGYEPTIANTASLGGISTELLSDFDWVIWNSDFVGGKPEDADTDVLWTYLTSVGSAVTVSGGHTGWNISPTTGADQLLALSPTGLIPELVEGIPSYVEISPDLPLLTPMYLIESGLQPEMILQQAEPSPQVGAPLMLVYRDVRDNVNGEVLVLIGMPLAWLPDGFGQMLIRNMAQWIAESR